MEWEDDSVTKIKLTAEDPVWYPTSPDLAEQKTATMNYRDESINHEAIGWEFFLSTWLVHAPMLQTSHMMKILV